MLDGKPYLDGGIADSVPLAAFERMGYARNVVVLTKEEGFQRRSDNIPLLNFRYRKYPRFLATLARRVELCDEEERYIQRAAADHNAVCFVVIRCGAPCENRQHKNCLLYTSRCV